ncbi:MAG: site-2 protease family protein [Desulfonatronovibrionaceae bacterium]
MPDIASILRELAIFAIPLLMGITCHEVAHGYVAYLLGDPTAKNAGRLTLNPIKHLDPLGTLVLVVTRRIGWAKPVPINPAYFQNYRRDMFLVSAAGPAANFLLGIGFYIFYLGIILSSTMFSPAAQQSILTPLLYITQAGVLVNFILGIFNLIPVPPLDGSKILASVLPPDIAEQYMSIERFGFFIILLLIFTGVLQKVLGNVVRFVFNVFF